MELRYYDSKGSNSLPYNRDTTRQVLDGSHAMYCLLVHGELTVRVLAPSVP